MKRNLIYFLNILFIFFCACTPSSKLVSSWKNEKQTGKSYKTVFIAVLNPNTIAKSIIEGDFESALNRHGIAVIKSIDEFPPKFSNDSLSREEIMKKVKGKGSDAILTVSIFKKATESRYVSGVYAPGMRFGYYGNFWGYYNYWWPFVYSPDYYTTEEVFYVEANLYDVLSQELVWSAQSETYEKDRLVEFSKQFSRDAVEKLHKDGILNYTITNSAVKK